MSILAILLATACTQAPAVEGDEVDSKKDGTAEPNSNAPTGTAQPESTSNSSPSTANPPMAEPIQPDPPVVPPETPPPPMVGRCDPKKPFGTPKLVAGLNTAPSGIGRLSMDELTLVFQRTATNNDIFVATRADRTAAWGEAKVIAPVSSPTFQDGAPTITGDGLTMYFHSNRTPSSGDYDLWVSRRAKAEDAWGTPARVTALASTLRDEFPFVRADGRMMVFGSNRGTAPTTYDLYRAYIDETGAPGAPTKITELSTTTADESNPVLTPDGLVLYFARRGVSMDIFVARRAALNVAFGAPTRIEELTTPGDERPSWISPDDCQLWYTAFGTGKSELYIAERGM
jgi:hypothetical protein